MITSVRGELTAAPAAILSCVCSWASYLEMPAIVLLVAIGDQEAPRFSGSDYGHDLIWLGRLEVGIDKVIAPSIGWLQYRRTPLLRPVCEPVLVLIGNVTEFVCV